MKIAYFLIFLVFSVNVAAGIAASMFEDEYSEYGMSGIENMSTSISPFEDPAMQQAIKAGGTVSSSSTQFDDILSAIGLGFIQKWVTVASDYLYGVNRLIFAIFGPYMNSNQLLFWFGTTTMTAHAPTGGILGLILSALWVIAALALFTGKNLFED